MSDAAPAVCQAAVDLVKHFEGLYLTAYRCPAGVPTIGYGHTQGVALGQTITKAQAEAFLAQDLAIAVESVEAAVRVPLNADQSGALASFVFNVGAGNFACSTLLKLLNQGDYAGAAGQFTRWCKARVNGRLVTLDGLLKRREAEEALFNGAPLPMAQDVADPDA